MPFNIGPFELLLVLVLALLVLGPGKLPEVGSALGRTIREFRKASTDVEEAVRIDPVTPTVAAATTNTVAPTAAAESTAVVAQPVVPDEAAADRTSEDRTAS